MSSGVILGMMQPYFFPHLGYFDLIHCSDRWVVFDTAQYIRHGWINRNRILHPSEGWQYIIVPLQKKSFKDPIQSVQVIRGRGWVQRILGQLHHYRNQAPYFEPVLQLVNECLSVEEAGISKLNVHALKKTCEYLDISVRFEFFSEMELEFGPVEGPGEWALRTCEALGATTYINPPGGREIFDLDTFRRSEIQLVFREMSAMEYNCGKYPFIPGLSVIDVLMWNSPDEVRDYLGKQKASLRINP